MCVYVAQTFPHKSILLNKVHHFIMFGKVRRRECGKVGQYLLSVFEVAASEFSDDEWMANDPSLV